MADADVPIKYMDRTRHYYRALGYAQDYIWATFDDVPFSPPSKPLSEMYIVLITTASPLDFDGDKRVWSGHVSPPPPKLFTDNVAWDKEFTHTQFTGPVFSLLKPLRSWHRKACLVTWRRVSTAYLPSTASAKRLRKMRWKFSRAFAKIGGGRRSSMSPLSCLPSNRQLGGSSPRNERDSYCNCRIGIGRCRTLRRSQVLFHGLSAWQSLRSSVAACNGAPVWSERTVIAHVSDWQEKNGFNPISDTRLRK